MSNDDCWCRDSCRNDPIAKLSGILTVTARQLTYTNDFLALLVDELLEARKLNTLLLADRATQNSQTPRWKHADEDG